MARRKKTQKQEVVEEVVETIEEIVEEEAPKPKAKAKKEEELVLPYSQLWQNVVWYIKRSGKKTTYGDLQRLHFTTFDEYKEHIDSL